MRHHQYLSAPPFPALLQLADLYKSESLDLVIEAQLGTRAAGGRRQFAGAAADLTAVGFLGDHQVQQWRREDFDLISN